MPLPFDLKKAQAGHPLVTRDGRKAKFVAYTEEAKRCQQVVAVIDHELYGFATSGIFSIGIESRHDLFLADPPKVKKSRYVAVCANALGGYCAESAASQEEWERKFPSLMKLRVAATIIEWEEPAP